MVRADGQQRVRAGGQALLAALLTLPPRPAVAAPDFASQLIAAAATSDPRDYAAGDLVTWMLPGNLPHIGIVTDRRTADGRRPIIVHNIGNGPELEDMLLSFPITGRYRYRGE
jgi:uncharacterized protein YijF (DUF1287 family)